MTDRERAIQAIRRGAPLGEVVMCSCHTSPPTRKGCFGVCEDSVAAIIASYDDIRREMTISGMIEITVPLCGAFREIGIDISEADLKRFERALYERGLNVAQRTSPPWHREMIDREPDHGQYAAALAGMAKNRKSK